MRVLELLLVIAWILIAVTFTTIGIYQLVDSGVANNNSGGWFLGGGLVLLFLITAKLGGGDETTKPTIFSVTIDVREVMVSEYGDWKELAITGTDGGIFKIIAEDGIAGLVVAGKKYTFSYVKSDDVFELVTLEEQLPT